MEILISLSHQVRPYLNQCAMAMIATVLVIYGSDINNAIKRLIARHHFLIRTLVFVLVCAFGYGLLTVWLTPLLAGQLARIPGLYLAPAIGLIFIALGILAQRQRQI
ncbi:DUF3392 domain-containing protein [Marinobacterium arenosum]|uniref:DUF3392 domain-containing protein n=1 Tax=Marinobacterium arenosum TaxID=2862496 RepID=UPI001C989D5D|nr:DUF3392 domain-containing protein [Marinobacterium arenosum]MBY4675477.1 DUF3392 domain-containing protein [Marinobacterium arenosum]